MGEAKPVGDLLQRRASSAEFERLALAVSDGNAIYSALGYSHFRPFLGCTVCTVCARARVSNIKFFRVFSGDFMPFAPFAGAPEPSSGCVRVMISVTFCDILRHCSGSFRLAMPPVERR
jgi:hypothetical protein